MSKKQAIFSPRTRKRKAYATAIRVFISYYWLYLKSKIRGQKYFDKRINALHRKNADRIKKRVQELQGLFIKVGQLISNLSNILPKEFRKPLESLQDHMEAKPYAEVAQTIREQLGEMPQNLFDNFNETALAAASIGQVHRAQIRGEEVVVKVQHANIDVVAAADLKIIKNLVKLHAFFMDMQGTEHMYEQVRQMIEEELDYTQEAKSMQTIYENLKTVAELNIKIPTIYPEFCTSKILVSSFCEGTKIANTDRLEEWGIDQSDIAKRLIELWCKMVLIDGFYHADPHPGNILVNEAGEIILLDFGAVAVLNDKMKKAIPKLIEAVIKNDTEETALALEEMGFIGSDKASRKYVEKLIEVFKNFLKEEVQLDGLNFQNIKLNSGVSSVSSILKQVDLRDVANTIRIPKDYVLLNRTVVLLMGNSFLLSPELNTVNVIRPYIKKHVLGQDGGFSRLIINTFKNQLTTALALPNELSQFLRTAKKGELEYEVKGLEEGMRKLLKLGRQFLYAFIVIAAVYFMKNEPPAAESLQLKVNWGIIILFSGLFVRTYLKS